MDDMVLRYPRTPCVSLRTLYGARNKNQHQNYLPIPVGSQGTILTEYEDDELGTRYYLVRFLVDGKKMYCRTDPSGVEEHS
jgi:hypothetical protein